MLQIVCASTSYYVRTFVYVCTYVRAYSFIQAIKSNLFGAACSDPNGYKNGFCTLAGGVVDVDVGVDIDVDVDAAVQ
jgi:hypothetical protein